MSEQAATIALIAGLGNPGPEHEADRQSDERDAADGILEGNPRDFGNAPVDAPWHGDSVWHQPHRARGGPSEHVEHYQS